MSKYKIGDKVKVREDLVTNELYEKEIFVDEMNIYKGKTTIIENVFENGEYRLVDCNYWAFTDEMLEPVLDNPVLDNLIKEFTIDDLIDTPLGTKITIDNRKEFVKIDNVNFEDAEHCISIGEEILENLTLSQEYSFVGYKITKVEIPEYKTIYVDNTKKKMTLKEIEKKLGYEVELVEE